VSRRRRGEAPQPGFTIEDRVAHALWFLNRPIINGDALSALGVDLTNPAHAVCAAHDSYTPDGDGLYTLVQLIDLALKVRHRGPGTTSKLTTQGALVAIALTGGHTKGNFDETAAQISRMDTTVALRSGLAWTDDDDQVHVASYQQIGNRFRAITTLIDPTPVPSRRKCPDPAAWKKKYHIAQIHDPAERAQGVQPSEVRVTTVHTLCRQGEARLSARLHP